MSKKSFMCLDIFNYKPNNINKNVLNSKSHNIIKKQQYKPMIGIEFLTLIIKSQNIQLLEKIANNEDLDLDELKNDFLKVSYYTPDIVSKLSDETNEKKRVLIKIKKIYNNL